jgi:hypothetical protein
MTRDLVPGAEIPLEIDAFDGRVRQCRVRHAGQTQRAEQHEQLQLHGSPPLTRGALYAPHVIPA